MQTPSSSPSKKVRRTFTERQANDSLVFVGAVVEDIVTKWSQILALPEKERSKHLEKLTYTEGPDNLLDSDDSLITQIHYHTRELTRMGCFVKNLGEGIILFPTKIQGEDSYYIWRPGDKAVRTSQITTYPQAKV